jgi:hypothetical protein
MVEIEQAAILKHRANQEIMTIYGCNPVLQMQVWHALTYKYDGHRNSSLT